MKTGRPTNEPKQRKLQIRISEDMMSGLERESSRRGKSISDIVRSGIVNELASKVPQTLDVNDKH